MSTSTPVTFIHLSDTHLVPPGQLAHGIDSRRLVDQAIARIRGLTAKPSWLIASGDLSEDGSPASYGVLNTIVHELEAEGIPVLLALGNHDQRQAFRSVVLGDTDTDPLQPYHYSRTIAGVRTIVLDSVIPGDDSGALGGAQLVWLDAELSEPAPNGTVVVLHHPCRLAAPAEHFPSFVLRDAPQLEAIVARHPGEVLGVLAGHSHQANAAPFAGAIHATAPAVLCQLDFFAGPKYVPIPGSGFNLCRIQDGALIAQPVIVDANADT